MAQSTAQHWPAMPVLGQGWMAAVPQEPSDIPTVQHSTHLCMNNLIPRTSPARGKRGLQPLLHAL